MPGRFANLKAYFSGRAWSTQLGVDLDEAFADLVQANNAAQGIPGPATTIEAGVESTAGTTTGTTPYAMEDHVHGIDTAAPAGLGNANTEGSGAALFRASGTIKRDVRVQSNDADVGTRNALDFADSADVTFLVVDDPGGDKVHVSAAFTSPVLVSPLTTKGDIWGFDTDDNRIPVGADGTVLTSDSTAALGVSWQPGSAYNPADLEYLAWVL